MHPAAGRQLAGQCLLRARYRQLSSLYTKTEPSQLGVRCAQQCLARLPAPLISVRGKKTTTTMRVEDLPQGMLSVPEISEPLEPEPVITYPTVIQQARNNMRKFENCVVLTRVGGFYELYFEQAEKYGPLLGIKVAKKSTSAGPVPMAGFPFFQLDRYLRNLVQEMNQAVAIAEEFPHSQADKAKSGGLLFDRRVARVVTPGTLVDEKFISPDENNFLLAIHVPPIPTGQLKMTEEPDTSTSDGEGVEPSPMHVGLAWLDLSTGEFFTQDASLNILASAATRIGAKEILIDSRIPKHQHAEVLRAVAPSTPVPWDLTAKDSPKSDLSALLNSTTSETGATELSHMESSAALLILDYVEDRLQGLSARLQPPIRWRDAENMGIDANTIKGLEILETSREAISGGKGSLLHSLRRTVSSGGARLLRTRISSPSTSLDTINQRLDLVQCFLDNKDERSGLTDLLKKTFDTQRLVQKFSLGRGDADNLVSLYKTISATRSIRAILTDFLSQAQNDDYDQGLITSLTAITARISMNGPDALASRIAHAIDEEGILEHHRVEEARAAASLATAREVMASEGGEEDAIALPRTTKGKAATSSIRPADVSQPANWCMHKNANLVLEELHAGFDTLLEQKVALEAELQEQIGSNNLTLRWTPGQGHICHVKGNKDVKMSIEVFPSARNAGSSKSTRSFYNSEWTRLGNKIDQQRLRILSAEESLFHQLRDTVVQNLVRLRRNAAVLDELDVACASAALAEEERLVRPILNNGTSHHIIGGRHATVKHGLDERGRAFVSNDCSIGHQDHVWLITGPNMAGKSTFLRQNALISILGQVGLFVPAAYAEMGIVDHVFSRIGSADNLYRDQSTFMVEMLESAHILRTATPRSLVIMDEVGRGTTPEDGTAVAFACLHHLYHVNRCRTLFATHFHALADWTQDWDRLGRYCTDVSESEDGSFHYDYRLREGVNRNSHALKVARLASMPRAVIDIAQSVLERSTPQPVVQTLKAAGAG